MASTDENPGLLARFYGSRQESSGSTASTRRRSAERPFPHNVQTTAANCLYPDTTRGRRNVGRAAETLTSRPGRKDPFTGALERGATDEVKDAIADESGRVNATDLHALDSLCAPPFDLYMFVLQMVLHLFWPLSLPLYPSRRFPRGARNQSVDLGALCRAHPAALFIQLGPLFCWGLLTIYLVWQKRFERSNVSSDEIFFIPIVMMAARLVAIAIKYATLTPVELKRFMDADDPADATKYMNQMQLLSGFLLLRDDVAERELQTAAERHGLDLETLAFEEPWRAFDSDDCEPVDKERAARDWDIFVGEKGDRSFRTLARSLYKDAIDAVPISCIFFGGLVIAGLIVLTPVIVRVIAGNRLRGDDPLVWACWVFAACLTFVNAALVTQFLAVGVVHDFRRGEVLSAYIRLLVRREACNLGGAPIPRLQICQRPLDGIVWVQGRAVLGSFGFRYERRAEYYLVLVTVVLGGAMVDFFIQLVTGHQRKLLTQSRTWALLFFLLLLFLVLVASAYFAALANEKCETAVSLFAQRRLAAQANAAQFPALAARAQASDEILACAAEQLEIYNRVHDARLFGIRADGGVIFSLVSLAVTFYVFVFFWMFGIDAGR